MNVIKRDGREESFNFSKVSNAIVKANSSLENPYDEALIETVLSKIDYRIKAWTEDTIEIEEIQNLVIHYLKKYCKRLAKHYSIYREERAKIRDAKENGKYYDTILELVNGVPNDTSKENSNKDASQINVIRDLIAGETSKKLYREVVMPAKLKELHDKGVIHVHDCDYRLQKGITNCELTNLEDVLNNGTVMSGKLIERPHSLQTACTIASQVITAVSSSTYGGQTITMTHLASFIEESRKQYEKITSDESTINKLLNREIKSAIQTLLYQLNTMISTNGQSPFITLFLYPDENSKYREDTMTLCKEVLRQRIEGMKSPSGHRINPTFPKLVVAITESMLDENHPDYEFTKLCAECVCMRMVPDFISEKNIKAIKEGCVIPPMGCRSFLHPWKNEKDEYQIYGRSNIGVISMNLPYLALESSTLEEFKQALRDMIDFVSYEQYKIYKSIAECDINIAPILYKYGVLTRFNDGKIEQAIGNNRASVSIGYMGLAEVVERFGVKYHSKEGHKLGLDIMKIMFDQANINREKYNIALSLYGTPAESLTTKFAKACKDFPTIPHVNDRDYITNSYHIQVEEPIDAFSKMDFESAFQKYSTGGAISYVEVPDIRHNPEVVISLMEHIYDKMTYCEINTTSCSICYECGFEGQIDMDKEGKCTCPNCGNTNPDKLYVVLRTCGYLGSFQYGSSKGRIGDIINRVKHL
jgi:anaerobic ribonucleoside-triphosphate reductase